MSFDKKNFLGALLAIPVITIWGITFVCTKSLLNDFSALEILFFRFLVAYLVLWIFYPHKLRLIQKEHEIYFMLAGLSGVVIYQLFENIAIHFTNASNVSVIVSICPMFTAILSQLILKEKSVTPFFALGFVVSIAGVFLVSMNGITEFHLNPAGDILALVSGISWGFYSILVSKINRLSYNYIGATRRIFFWAVIFMTILILLGAFLPILKGTSLEVSFNGAKNVERFSKPINWANLLFLGVLASAFCFMIWNKVCALLGTVKATVGIYLIPVVTIIFAFIFLHEKITLMGSIGTVCTILGVAISGIKKSRD